MYHSATGFDRQPDGDPAENSPGDENRELLASALSSESCEKKNARRSQRFRAKFVAQRAADQCANIRPSDEEAQLLAQPILCLAGGSKLSLKNVSRRRMTIPSPSEQQTAIAATIEISHT